MENNSNSFFSIDRLVEFGLGMAVAQQMVRSMNLSMASMQVPGSSANPFSFNNPTSEIYYVAIDNKPVGPINASEVQRLVCNKIITPDSLGWTPGMVKWEKVSEIPSFLKIIALTPPPL